MSTLTNWVLYLDENDKVEAIEDDHTGLMTIPGKIIGYVSFKDKSDAKLYGEQVLCPSK